MQNVLIKIMCVYTNTMLLCPLLLPHCLLPSRILLEKGYTLRATFQAWVFIPPDINNASEVKLPAYVRASGLLCLFALLIFMFIFSFVQT